MSSQRVVLMPDSQIFSRTNRILNFFLFFLFLILIRVWILGVIQYEEYYKESLKPQRRVVIQPIERATIYDRFNIPLAVNKNQYNAAICYGDIRQIPTRVWKKDKNGKSKKVMKRIRYIEKLSTFLAKELDMDPQAIEDTIHGKASLFPHTPFVIKEDIPEDLYYRLKMCEKNWVGMVMQRDARRV